MALCFRPLARSDFPLLAQWLRAQHVATWWREAHSLESIEQKYGPRVDGTEPTAVFVVEVDGEPVGMIQRYRIGDHPEWERAMAVALIPSDAVGIDYLIGVPALTGKGLGPEIIVRFVEDTLHQHPNASAIAVGVQQANRRSWRALEKAGFDRSWAGMLDSNDPSDEGPGYVYLRRRLAT